MGLRHLSPLPWLGLLAPQCWLAAGGVAVASPVGMVVGEVLVESGEEEGEVAVEVARVAGRSVGKVGRSAGKVGSGLVEVVERVGMGRGSAWSATGVGGRGEAVGAAVVVVGVGGGRGRVEGIHTVSGVEVTGGIVGSSGERWLEVAVAGAWVEVGEVVVGLFGGCLLQGDRRSAGR